MVFKAVTGANQKALDIYKSGCTFNEDQLKAIDVTNRFPNDYRNRIVLNWEDFGATEVNIVTQNIYTLFKVFLCPCNIHR